MMPVRALQNVIQKTHPFAASEGVRFLWKRRRKIPPWRGCTKGERITYWILREMTYAIARNRKVTTWARLQVTVGPKVVAVRPLVMPFSTAHSMGSK